MKVKIIEIIKLILIPFLAYAITWFIVYILNKKNNDKF